MRRFDAAERRARLGLRHHLAKHAHSPTLVAGDLVGLHSSDPATVYLSLRARTVGFTVDDLDTALYEERTLVRMLGMRRTMFVVPVDLAGTMDAACTQALVDREERRLAGLVEGQGLAPDGAAWVARVESDTLRALAELGPATARELTEVVPELGWKVAYATDKPYGGTFGLSTRVLFLLATRGEIVRGRPLGTWLSSQYRWAVTETWLGRSLTFPAPAQARADLARRWLRSFGPGTETDLKWWAGWNLRDTRRTLEAVGAVQVELEGGTSGFVLPDDLEPAQPPEGWASFLPSLDPTPMGWKERAWFLGEQAHMLYDRNGNVGPTIWVNGRVVGGWSQSADARVRYRIIEPASQEELGLIEAEADRIDGWLGDVVVKPRFGTPLDKDLRQL